MSPIWLILFTSLYYPCRLSPSFMSLMSLVAPVHITHVAHATNACLMSLTHVSAFQDVMSLTNVAHATHSCRSLRSIMLLTRVAIRHSYHHPRVVPRRVAEANGYPDFFQRYCSTRTRGRVPLFSGTRTGVARVPEHPDNTQRCLQEKLY